jgi:radical SAM superfamily enzyme YgiQ (UPF0313 family)
MAGLGYQLVWSLLEKDETLDVHRGFTDMTQPGANTSELFGFTLSWELDFINVLNILKENGINPLASRRTDQDPIVFGGGPVLTANPEPFADFFDVILLGDAEATVPAFIEAFKQCRGAKNRKEKLIALANISGIYIPQFYECTYHPHNGSIKSIQITEAGIPEFVSKQTFTAPNNYVAHSVILSPDTTWGNTFLIEVVRSCPQECRFCLASFLTRPFRATNVEAIVDTIDFGLKHTKKIGLLGPSITEHPEFEKIAEALLKRPETQISIASVRADTLSEPILRMLKELGQKSITIAIESGSERLRSIMKKNLTEEEIFRAIDLIASAGLTATKFYGIVGLPYETKEDLDETIRLMTALKKSHKQMRFTLGISSFVPKAQTPFQWAGRDRKCKQKIEYVRKNLAKIGIDIRPESHNWSDIQTLLSRGDRRLTPLLMQVAEAGGTLGAWKREAKNCQKQMPDLDYYIFRNIPETELLPWHHLTDSARTAYLQKHLSNARSAEQILSTR